MFILFDQAKTRQNLLPLTYTRPIADCRVGIMTIREKWEHYIGENVMSLTESYLENKFPFCHTAGAHTYINSSVIPNEGMIAAVHTLAVGNVLKTADVIIAFCTDKTQVNYENLEVIAASAPAITFVGKCNKICFAHDIFKLNGEEIASDFTLLTKGRSSQKLNDSNRVIGDATQIYIEEGASVECAILNTKAGPIYIGKHAEVMEGCLVRGPFALCEYASLKMGAKIYSATTIGPQCKVGGELSNSVFFGYSNKGHDGFVGNSVIGEWCNLGADTNTSNLKNNYGNIGVWNYREEKSLATGLQFHGLVMGDHGKSGINTMFNTGTVVGVAANIFGGGFPDKFIPSFSWGGADKLETYRFDKALEVASRMMERRNITLSQADIDILKVAFERDAKYRSSEASVKKSGLSIVPNV